MSGQVMRIPREVEVQITSRCNLRCRYCSFFDHPEPEYRDLPTEEWLGFFDELGGLGVMKVTLTGGEPFMRKDLPLLIDKIVRNRMRYTILSNGALIRDEMAGFLAATGRCDVVQVSIDGSAPPTHDVFRGKGSFARSVRGLKALIHHRVPATSRVTVHRGNVSDLAATVRLLLEEIGLPSISVNSAGALGSCQRNREQVLMTVSQRQEAIESLLRLADAYPGRIKANAGPLAEARHGGEPPFPSGGKLTACRCPRSKIVVRSDGVVVPCTLLPHMEVGRINRDSLAGLWSESPILAGLRDRVSIPLRDFPFCEGCAFTDYCTGNCPALAYTAVGRVDHPDPNACLRKFLAERGAIT
jgi:SynChlorMet cassette radical SAM/SPASM protein ScmE